MDRQIHVATVLIQITDVFFVFFLGVRETTTSKKYENLNFKEFNF